MVNAYFYYLICKNQCTSDYKVTSVIKSHSKDTEIINRRKQLAILSTCFFNMGLTWGFSLLVTIPSSVYVQTVFAFLFSFFNSFQGFFIFIVYNFLSKSRRENLKDSMKKTFSQIKKQFSLSSNSSA
jgi:hypothetical protein